MQNLAQPIDHCPDTHEWRVATARAWQRCERRSRQIRPTVDLRRVELVYSAQDMIDVVRGVSIEGIVDVALAAQHEQQAETGQHAVFGALQLIRCPRSVRREKEGGTSISHRAEQGR
jgi:hypothetical protein